MFKDTMDRTILAGAVVGGGGGYTLAQYHAIAGLTLTVIMIFYVSSKLYFLWHKRRKTALEGVESKLTD